MRGTAWMGRTLLAPFEVDSSGDPIPERRRGRGPRQIASLKQFVGVVLALAAGGLLAAGPAAAQSPPMPFPDVPPWHWAYRAVLMDQQTGLFIGYPSAPAELVDNSIRQVYAGFAHAHAAGAQAWVERFTYDRPARWPAPLDRSELVAWSLGNLRPVVTGDAAVATFTARVTLRMPAGAAGVRRTTAVPMRVALRLSNGDWQIDYATLARGGAPFR